jgi:hypothetical protein
MEIVERNISELIEAEYNPRQITDKQFEQLKDSLKRFGFVDPVLVNMHPERENIIIGGHMRTKAAKDLGYTEVPCVELNLTYDQEKELNIRLNKNGGSFDMDALANYFSADELVDWGFDASELGDVITEEPPGEEGEVDLEPPKEPITVLGDLYELNGHRLLCGDSTNQNDIDKLMNGVTPAMVFTDPPFDMDYELILSVFGLYPDLFQVWVLDDRNAVRLAGDNVDSLFTVMVYVAKNSMLTNNKQPIRVHCLMPVFNFKNAHSDLINYTTVFEHGRPLTYIGKTGASHSKPTQLFDSTLRYWLKEGEIVADWFAHSGSVLIAAEQENRLCYSQELDPKYCDVIVRRWVKYMQDNNKPYTVRRNGHPLSEKDFAAY